VKLFSKISNLCDHDIPIGHGQTHRRTELAVASHGKNGAS